ncbi:hypothetical protein FA15DRAFT_656601 [Coprinopsis marcescibilis]|uniref:Uncharacterized protein n=1 Tax=Coprinopsis marcescibilis TaxID=230819 RepID=A0A5C3KSW9_COPMA|nr:hypothetical protein FA15DRAFT_656601 [Coprinopsis marcescibilis]
MLTYTPEALCEAASNYRHQWSVAWVLSSVSVNEITTSLIAYRLVTATQGISAMLPSNRTTATTDKMIIFLVEAALPTAVFGLLIETQGGMVVAYTLVQVSYTLFTCFVALAPQLIILRVTSGRSWTNSGELTGAASQVMLRPAELLTFACTQRPSTGVCPLCHQMGVITTENRNSEFWFCCVMTYYVTRHFYASRLKSLLFGLFMLQINKGAPSLGWAGHSQQNKGRAWAGTRLLDW